MMAGAEPARPPPGSPRERAEAFLSLQCPAPRPRRSPAPSPSPETDAASCFVITSAEAPYNILTASPSWFNLWGFSEAEAVGAPVSILNNVKNNGEGYDAQAPKGLMQQFAASGR